MPACGSGGSSDTSTECSADADCATGTCYTDSTPGYCTKPCEVEGDTGDCLPDTVCKRIEGTEFRCILICEAPADCGTNADCNNVPDSSLKGCEPVH
jgi:hypothetical protein